MRTAILLLVLACCGCGGGAAPATSPSMVEVAERHAREMATATAPHVRFTYEIAPEDRGVAVDATLTGASAPHWEIAEVRYERACCPGGPVVSEPLHFVHNETAYASRATFFVPIEPDAHGTLRVIVSVRATSPVSKVPGLRLNRSVEVDVGDVPKDRETT